MAARADAGTRYCARTCSRAVRGLEILEFIKGGGFARDVEAAAGSEAPH